MAGIPFEFIVGPRREDTALHNFTEFLTAEGEITDGPNVAQFSYPNLGVTPILGNHRGCKALQSPRGQLGGWRWRRWWGGRTTDGGHLSILTSICCIQGVKTLSIHGKLKRGLTMKEKEKSYIMILQISMGVKSNAGVILKNKLIS